MQLASIVLVILFAFIMYALIKSLQHLQSNSHIFRHSLTHAEDVHCTIRETHNRLYCESHGEIFPWYLQDLSSYVTATLPSCTHY